MRRLAALSMAVMLGAAPAGATEPGHPYAADRLAHDFVDPEAIVAAGGAVIVSGEGATRLELRRDRAGKVLLTAHRIGPWPRRVAISIPADAFESVWASGAVGAAAVDAARNRKRVLVDGFPTQVDVLLRSDLECVFQPTVIMARSGQTLTPNPCNEPDFPGSYEPWFAAWGAVLGRLPGCAGVGSAMWSVDDCMLSSGRFDTVRAWLAFVRGAGAEPTTYRGMRWLAINPLIATDAVLSGAGASRTKGREAVLTSLIARMGETDLEFHATEFQGLGDARVVARGYVWSGWDASPYRLTWTRRGGTWSITALVIGRARTAGWYDGALKARRGDRI